MLKHQKQQHWFPSFVRSKIIAIRRGGKIAPSFGKKRESKKEKNLLALGLILQTLRITSRATTECRSPKANYQTTRIIVQLTHHLLKAAIRTPYRLHLLLRCCVQTSSSRVRVFEQVRNQRGHRREKPPWKNMLDII